MKEFEEFEKKRLREKWRQELEHEKLRKEKEKAEKISEFNEIEEYNRKELELKKALMDQEKENDKILIKTILDKEKALDEIDKKEKVNIIIFKKIYLKREHKKFSSIKTIYLKL